MYITGFSIWAPTQKHFLFSSFPSSKPFSLQSFCFKGSTKEKSQEPQRRSSPPQTHPRLGKTTFPDCFIICLFFFYKSLQNFQSNVALICMIGQSHISCYSTVWSKWSNRVPQKMNSGELCVSRQWVFTLTLLLPFFPTSHNFLASFFIPLFHCYHLLIYSALHS